jgi:hypothetical protein
MPFMIMINFHPMLGVDYHIPWPPGSPAPLPAPAPYSTYHILGNPIGWAAGQAKVVTSEWSGWGFCMQKDTDIGMIIPHIGPPSITLPLEILLSSSKSCWGSMQKQVSGQPVCCALLVSVNPNLNCGTPFPTPTGFVMAINTHMVDMTWGEILGGLVNMVVTGLLQFGLNKLGGAIGNRLATRFASPMVNAWATRMAGAYTRNMAARFLAAGLPFTSQRFTSLMQHMSRRYAESMGQTVVGAAVGFLLGGPMGADGSTVGIPTPGGAASDGIIGFAEKRAQERVDGGEPSYGDSNGTSSPSVRSPAQPGGGT